METVLASGRVVLLLSQLPRFRKEPTFGRSLLSIVLGQTSDGQGSARRGAVVIGKQLLQQIIVSTSPNLELGGTDDVRGDGQLGVHLDRSLRQASYLDQRLCPWGQLIAFRRFREGSICSLFILINDLFSLSGILILVCLLLLTMTSRANSFMDKISLIEIRTNQMGFPVVLVVKNLSANAGNIRDVSVILGSRRCSGEGHGNPLQYSCLEKPMGRGAWQATVHRVAKSWM